MRYIATHFNFDRKADFVADVLADFLGDIGYESFVDTPTGLDAYIKEKDFDLLLLDDTVARFPFEIAIQYKNEPQEDKNWNEEWEKHFFEPIIIDGQCVIHSSFHKDFPALKYDIVIDPKMAFGTGHHETTSLMIAEILNTDMSGKSVLDMGCGTSVLAVLAEMKGAAKITAIDIDDWCVDNSLENIALNGAKNIEVLLGDASLLTGRHFEIILANINRNILLADMGKYSACLPKGGLLFMSGFYVEDIPALESKGRDHSLSLEYFKQKNNWAAVKMVKR